MCNAVDMQPWLPLVLGCALLAGRTPTVSGRGSLDAKYGPPASHGPREHVAVARIPLRRSDLPNGWTGHKYKSDAAGNASQEQVDKDVAILTGPRIEADVGFFNIGARVDPGLQQQLIAVVARRAANA
jgi:hypothetical protein